MNRATPSASFDYEAALFACARGERGALRDIYEYEASRLLGVAYRILRRHDLAEEVVHDAFLQIWQRSGTFNPIYGSARAWIYSIVRHRAINILRDTSRETAVEDAMLEDTLAVDADPLQDLSRMTEAAALQRCLAQLEPAKKMSLLLAYLDGYSHSQIARRLNAPLGTVKAWIRRGLQELRECLS
jgi:RNA polymerase sigma-70 factor, ECF subfamily